MSEAEVVCDPGSDRGAASGRSVHLDLLADNDARRRAVNDLDQTFSVVAGAGTGKTTVLVDRIVKLVRVSGASMRDIAAITFTEAAAAELRDRVRSELTKAVASGRGDRRVTAAIEEADEAAICTLHSFAQRILSENCLAAGLPPNFEVMDESAASRDFKERWERYADELFENPDAERALISGFAIGLKTQMLERVARSLQDNWDRMAESGTKIEGRDVRGLGHTGPSTWPKVDVGPVIAAIDRALACEPQCRNKDDLLLRHLRTTLRKARSELECGPGDDHSTLQVLASLDQLGSRNGKREHWTGNVEDVRRLCSDAEEVRQRLLQSVRDSVLEYLIGSVGEFVRRSAGERAVEGRLTYHDLLVRARQLLRDDTGACAAIAARYKWVLIDEFQDTDPIQTELAARLASETNGSCDLSKIRSGGLFVVGDPKQSIYRFRRADISQFERFATGAGERIALTTNFRSVPGIIKFVNGLFAEIFAPPTLSSPGDSIVGSSTAAPVFDSLNNETSELGQAASSDLRAYRSPLGPAAGRTRVRSSRARKTAPMSADERLQPNDEAERSSEQLAFTGFEISEEREHLMAAGPLPVVVLGGPLTPPNSATDVRRRAAGDIAEMALRMRSENWRVEDHGRVRSAKWRDVAVVIPTRTALPTIEDAFDFHCIPYRLEGTGMLWGSQDVLDVISLLRAAEDPDDAVAVVGALRTPGLACGDDDLITWRKGGGSWDYRDPSPRGLEDHPVAVGMSILCRLREERMWSSPSEIVQRAIELSFGYEIAFAHPRPRDWWHRLNWVIDQARLFDDTNGGTLRDFIAWADLRAESNDSAGVGPPEDDDDCVRVMTIHGAKGLEFPIVIVAGLGQDDASTYQDPPLLFADDGHVHVKCGATLSTSGYAAARDRDRRLDVLEKHRLLYVAMTRARDHLVLAIHHKEQAEREQAKNSPGALVWDFCQRHPGLWRRPSAQSFVFATRAQNVAEAVTERHLEFLLEHFAEPSVGRAKEPGNQPGTEWAVRREEWLRNRRDKLEALRRQPVVSVTALAESELSQVGGGSRERDVAPFGGTTPAAGSASGDTALRFGRAVHAVLSSLDLSEHLNELDKTLRRADIHEISRRKAVSHRVPELADDVISAVQAALSTETMRNAARARHWRELFIAAPTDGGTVVEGYVDLVYETADGSLVVVDFKTDRLSASSGDEGRLLAYELQVAGYAATLERSTGLTVEQCVLVMLGTNPATESTIVGERLASLKMETTRIAEGFDQTGP